MPELLFIFVGIPAIILFLWVLIKTSLHNRRVRLKARGFTDEQVDNIEKSEMQDQMAFSAWWKYMQSNDKK